jgi:hypothetical protein
MLVPTAKLLIFRVFTICNQRVGGSNPSASSMTQCTSRVWPLAQHLRTSQRRRLACKARQPCGQVACAMAKTGILIAW